jgi:hypothetical protein
VLAFERVSREVTKNQGHGDPRQVESPDHRTALSKLGLARNPFKDHANLIP